MECRFYSKAFLLNQSEKFVSVTLKLSEDRRK